MPGLGEGVEPRGGERERVEAERVGGVGLALRDRLAARPHLRAIVGRRGIGADLAGAVHDRAPHPFAVEEPADGPAGRRRGYQELLERPHARQTAAVRPVRVGAGIHARRESEYEKGAGHDRRREQRFGQKTSHDVSSHAGQAPARYGRRGRSPKQFGTDPCAFVMKNRCRADRLTGRTGRRIIGDIGAPTTRSSGQRRSSSGA